MTGQLEILDLEPEDGDSLETCRHFKVVFEVPGSMYGQDYPKRLSHVFPNKKRFFKEVENGDKRLEKILKDLYLENDADGSAAQVKDELKGKTYDTS